MSTNCERDGCTFVKHAKVENNGGTHCCKACKTKEGSHGPACVSKKVVVNPNAAVAGSKCEREGCTKEKHARENNNGGTHCCKACKNKEGSHGPNCTSKAPVTGA
jgi:hypothetical protein